MGILSFILVVWLTLVVVQLMKEAIQPYNTVNEFWFLHVLLAPILLFIDWLDELKENKEKFPGTF